MTLPCEKPDRAINVQVPLKVPLVNPIDGRYNNAEYTYTCIDTGIYFFSMSVGVPAGGSAQVGRLRYLLRYLPFYCVLYSLN